MASPKKIKYRSGLEKSFGELLTKEGIKFEFEKTKLKYIQPQQERSYLIDFTINGNLLYVETKGRLTSEDRKKMSLIKEQYPDLNIVMVFSSARRKKIYKGSPTTYADWCDKKGIKWLELKDIEKDKQCLLSMIKPETPSCLKTSQRKNKRLSSLSH